LIVPVPGAIADGVNKLRVGFTASVGAGHHRVEVCAQSAGEGKAFVGAAHVVADPFGVMGVGGGAFDGGGVWVVGENV